MSIQFYLQSRGKTIDYRFLYEAPSSEWWRYYADYTLFEDETIILERWAGKECRLYLSGIPSNRPDRVNRIIRYTLVAELGKGEVSEKAFQLVRQFLDDCRNKSNTLGESLDRFFQEGDIEDALRYTESSNKERQDQISQKIANLVKSGSKFSSPDQCLEGICWGGLLSDKSFKAWLSLASRILIDGEPGVAALLNATSEKSLPSLKERLHREDIENIFILLPDNDTLPTPIRDIPKPIEGFKGKVGNIIGGLADNFRHLQTKVYIGASVLISAFIFLVFMLVR
jgi:hypothetical protein